jgi:WhiB family redox-sensing transcriptional regulator
LARTDLTGEDQLTLRTDEFVFTVDWRINAACRDTDPELFFPIGTTGPAVDQIESAKGVCIGCMARCDCLDFAIATNQDSGVWGGTTEDERRTIRRKLRAAQI